MTMLRDPIYAGHRYPAEIISCGVFSVPVEPAHGRGDAGRPRHLCNPRDDPAMGSQIRSGIRRGDKWHLDEVVISIAGKKHWL
jgi:putative transposase